MKLLGIKPKRRKKNTKKKNSQNEKGYSKNTTIEYDDGPKLVKGKYDTTLLRQQVTQTEYISNLRIGRSWILPQLVQMGFKKRGLSYTFDISVFERNLKKKYDSSIAGRNQIWSLLKRNYRAIAVTEDSVKRSTWWTKDLLVEMLKWDFEMVGKRSKGLNREECIKILNSIDDIINAQQICDVVEKYDSYRMRKREVYRSVKLPMSFINAYMADGAYNAMMTMVKLLNIRIKGSNGNTLTRDECINEIEKQSNLLNGRELLEYCKETFFDSGAFQYKKYIR